MRVLSFRSKGKDSYGVVSGDGVVDVGAKLKYPDLRAVLAAGALAEVKKAAEGAKPDAKLSDIKYLPVITNPDKIFMAGVNYHAHREEAGRQET